MEQDGKTRRPEDGRMERRKREEDRNKKMNLSNFEDRRWGMNNG
jgi:hypothetical protein